MMQIVVGILKCTCILNINKIIHMKCSISVELNVMSSSSLSSVELDEFVPKASNDSSSATLSFSAPSLLDLVSHSMLTHSSSYSLSSSLSAVQDETTTNGLE